VLQRLQRRDDARGIRSVGDCRLSENWPVRLLFFISRLIALYGSAVKAGVL
jgi:hypothetical protein